MYALICFLALSVPHFEEEVHRQIIQALRSARDPAVSQQHFPPATGTTRRAAL